jgi:hypothetical protein
MSAFLHTWSGCLLVTVCFATVMVICANMCAFSFRKGYPICAAAFILLIIVFSIFHTNWAYYG